MGNRPGSCVLATCESPAIVHRWCRSHWDEMLARDIDIEVKTNTLESAARKLVKQDRQLTFLIETDIPGRSFCTSSGCGHMARVHSHGGCFGLVGYDDDWSPCRCQGFTPSTPKGGDAHDHPER